MQKHKKLLSFIVSLAMCSSLVPMSVSADTADIDYSQTHSTSVKFEPVEKTPEQYLFNLENSTKNYILLDSTTVDGKKEFFVMTDYLAPKSGSFDATAVEGFTDGGNCYRFVKKNSGATWDKDSGNYAYDPQNPNSIAYFINSDAFTNVMIDSSVDEYVQSHTWKNEPVWSTGTGNTTEFTVSEYALPSISEYLAYSDKIGSKPQLLVPNGYYYHWYFRSPFADGSASSYIMYKDGTYIRSWSFPDYWDTSLRPAFYLSEDFFKNVKLDTSDLCIETVSMIDFSSLLTKDEALALGYTEDEWNFISLKKSDDITLTSNGGDRVKSGYTLAVNGISETDTVSYYVSNYYVSNNKSLGSVINNATGTSLTLTNDLEKKYITAVVETSDGSRYITNTVYCDANLPSYTGWITTTLVNPNDDASWKMKLVGQPGEFTIVDYDENSKEMLIMSGLAVKSYEKGSEQYTSTENIQIYDETDPNSIAYRINQTSFIDERLISEEYINYIPVKFWETEKYYNGDDFVSQARVALPSLTELMSDTYKDRIGYVVGKGTGEQAGFKLRTPYSSDTQFYYIHNVTDAGSARSVNASSTYYPSRVELYLNSDILKEVKLDFENSGSNTIELMKSILTPEQGVALYGADVWEGLFPADITGAVEGSFTIQNNGKVKSGYTLSVAPAAEISLDGASVQYIASADGASWVNVSNATATDYTITNDKTGKYLAALVTINGTKYMSNVLGPVEANLTYEYKWQATYPLALTMDDPDYAVKFEDSPAPFTLVEKTDGKALYLSKVTGTECYYMLTDESGKSTPAKGMQIYDSKDTNSIAYKMNTESFISDNLLPAEYHDFIEVTAWETEGSGLVTPEEGHVTKMANDTVDFAKIAYPSLSELQKISGYRERVGYNESNCGITLRTPKINDIEFFTIHGYANGYVSESGSETKYYANRSQMYVNDDIYKSAKIDVANSGLRALAELDLPSIMSVEEAKALGYNNTELTKLGFGDDKYANIVNLYTDGGIIKAEIEYVNYGSATTVDVFVSVYGADDRLKTVQKASVTLDGAAISEIKSVETPSEVVLEDGDYIKMFVWEGTTIKPVANAVDKEQKYIPELKAVADGNISFENTDFFAFNGRWLKTEAGMVSNWVRPYVEFDVIANDDTSVKVNFIKPDRTANVKLFVNGSCVAGMGTVSQAGYNEDISWDISEYLTNGVNHIRFMNTSSSQLTFKGVDITGAIGYLSATPKENNILFIGDSISEQEGYTLYVPTRLNADFTTVAKSGIALLNGHFGGGNKDGAIGMMDKFYHYESISDATTNIGTTPYDFENTSEYSAIVINIGTNDPFTTIDTDLNTSPFAQQYDILLKDLSAKYPNAEILVVKPIRKFEERAKDEGFSNDFRNQMYNKIGEKINEGVYGDKVHFVDTWEWDITMALSESIHPNNVGYNQMSEFLIDYMTENAIIK